MVGWLLRSEDGGDISVNLWRLRTRLQGIYCL